MSHGTPPPIPTEFLPYESYTEDPKWQTRFTAMWCGALALAVLLAAPRALGVRNLKESARGLLGVRMRSEYEALPRDNADMPSPPNSKPRPRVNGLTTATRVLGSFRLWSLSGITLNIGQSGLSLMTRLLDIDENCDAVFIVAGYAVFALVCIVLQAPLVENPNRAGFLALAQLPPVFIFASKNSPLTALLLGPGVDYTKLNYIHRWAGRGLFLGALVHGALWINNHLVWDLPILSQQKEGSGVAALACLCVIVLSSIAPVRRRCYSAFLVIHFLTFPAFFITICYHTIYATPWIFPPIAFYAADVLLRLLRFRVVATRVKPRDGGLTLIHVPLATGGWRAGQHLQVRAMIGGRAWEAHPLSVCCAEPGVTCLKGPDGAPFGMLLAARACGDWSRALYAFALSPSDDFDEPASPGAEHEITQEKNTPGRDAHLILDGPYGGPTLRATDYESILLFAGGSGATFTLAVLDDLVGRCARDGGARRGGERTRRVVWCWCVRSFGTINWFAPHLLQIATAAARPSSGIQLTLRIYVTCLCDPDAVLVIPGCTVTEARPRVESVLVGLLSPSWSSEVESEASSASASTEDVHAMGGKGDLEVGGGESEGYVNGGGGVAVLAAGPGGLIREAGNAVARANLGARGRAAGGVVFCAETFTV
ncbi:ferric reductase like transmembrane component-domain-containing protein [Mycena rosella]|uniref:Ferric reductase like transmembrane component-domain-containing protein n=1 Tax=Mycena rosella TaxID=1033263 RepID=A0AAD7M6G9_MYCRO|nr:ferric reductase like transmembrane component-domain-containing protein [Mycena rosella]